MIVGVEGGEGKVGEEGEGVTAPYVCRCHSSGRTHDCHVELLC